MDHKNRAIGLVGAVLIIFLAGIMIVGLGGTVNYGILLGPLFMAVVEYWRYKKTTVILVNDSGGELILSGNVKGQVERFAERGWRVK